MAALLFTDLLHPFMFRPKNLQFRAILIDNCFIFKKLQYSINQIFKKQQKKEGKAQLLAKITP